MKRKLLTFAAAAFLFVACNNESKTDETKKEDDKKAAEKTSATESTPKDKAPVDPCAGQPVGAPMPGMDSTMMKNWAMFMTPGEVHQMLAKSDGDWNGAITSWMDPKMPPTKSTGTSTNKMILGGRYQQSEYSGCFGGQPFQGFSITAYDNARKLFMSTWIDNFGTSIMNMTGTWDAAKKTVHFKGKNTDGMTGKLCDVREEFIMVDDNTQKLEMYGPDPKGKEYKTMEIVFTRKK